MLRLLAAALFVAFIPSASFADEGFPHGRLRTVEDGVTVQRATEPGAEEAVPNMPFLPGDRAWTAGHGRVEFQFSDGTVLRLDRRAKLDYVSHEEGAEGERNVLRLWSGSAFLRTRDTRGALDFAIETPAGVVEARERGVYRIDVEGSETRVAVLEGEASLEAGRRVVVRAGEETFAARGESPRSPRSFDRRAAADEFARWDEDAERRYERASRDAGHLPEELYAYAGELDTYGDWYHEAEIGHVWRPRVAAGWSPYSSGRWMWTPYGWTWVPHEPWGWAPSHYGRWGHSPRLGWYWIPGRTWGPAWVSWAIGGDYVGWAPLGHRDRVTVVRDRHGSGWRDRTPWNYSRRGDMEARDHARPRVQPTGEMTRAMRVIDNPHARPTRDLGSVRSGDAAVPRHVRTKPTPGDTVPELRADPLTTIPFPVARRKPREETSTTDADRDKEAQRARHRGFRFGQDSGTEGQGAAAPADGGGVVRSGRTPPDVRGMGVSMPPAAPTPPPPGVSPGAAPPPGDGYAKPREEATPPARRDRSDEDALGRLFRPLVRPREAEAAPRGDRAGSRPERPEGTVTRGEGHRARPQGDGRARPQGDGQARPPQPTRSASPSAEGAVPRNGPKKNEE